MQRAYPAIPGDFPRVGGTSAGGYYEIEPRLLVAAPTPGYIQTEAGARASLAEFERIARERGAACAVIVLVDNVASQDAAARRVWVAETRPELMCCCAMVCSSLLSRAIGSFFLGLNRPRVAAEMHPNIEAAIAWARDMLQNHEAGPE